jgi:hypothetical protein
MDMGRYSKKRFAIWFERGHFTPNGGEATHWWIGQDGCFWVSVYFRNTYQTLANPVAIHDARY